MRFLRFVWPLVFFIPLGDFAGRYCWLTGIDPIYHTLVFTHTYMPQILLAYALVSVLVVLISDVRARAQLRQLAGFASPPPSRLKRALAQECAALGMPEPRCSYLDVEQSFCFTASGPTGVLISRGFLAPLSDEELLLALRHEIVHLRRSHPEKALAWRIVTRLLLLPGFASIERWRHARREEIADRETAGGAVERYRRLLLRTAARNDTALLSWRLNALRGVRPHAISIWPAVVAAVLLVALVSSHFVFMDNAAYLMTHHC
ncbi:MAG: hypothetical protein NVS2B17_31270 [Candidatus Velthaea sp.]